MAVPGGGALAALPHAEEELVGLGGVVLGDHAVEVGHRDPHDPAGAQHPVQLAEQRLRLAGREVLEDVGAEYRLERAVGVGQRLGEVEVVQRPERSVPVGVPTLVGEPAGAAQHAGQPGDASDRQVRRHVRVEPPLVGDVERPDVELRRGRRAAATGQAHRRGG